MEKADENQRKKALVRVSHRDRRGADLVVAVQGGDFVAFGEGGVVEDGVDEVVKRAAKGEDSLAYVDQLSGLCSNYVYPQQLSVVPVE